MPEGQDRPDTKTTLEQDGLITCQYDEHGNYVSTIVHDPQHIRVLCWQLTVNAEARRLGRCFYGPACRPDRQWDAVARR